MMPKRFTGNTNRSLTQYPYRHKKLSGKWEGFHRYKVITSLGNEYRIIYKIIKKQVTVSVVKVGLRENVYKVK